MTSGQARHTAIQHSITCFTDNLHSVKCISIEISVMGYYNGTITMYKVTVCKRDVHVTGQQCRAISMQLIVERRLSVLWYVVV